MKKGIVAISWFLLCVLLLTTNSSFMFASNGDDVLSPKKIISVVYDDSGSMSDYNRYVYTNYAMQGLTALLNERDELYITAMTSADIAQRYSLKNISDAVKKIKSGYSPKGSTPAQTIATAEKALRKSTTNDISTQYWLVVMTDGGFDEYWTDPGKLQERLDSLKGKVMPNQSALNVIYLGMGNADMSVQEDPSRHLFVRYANSEQEITSTLADVANMISGRLPFDNIKQTDKKTISLSSKLPLYSISVLLQKSNAKITSARTNEESLNVSRNIDLQSSSSDASFVLKGNAGVVNKVSSGNLTYIPAGQYTITFSENISVRNIVAQYEPAIGVKTIITKDGNPVTDFAVLKEGDKIDIRVMPVIPGTDKEIPQSDIPKSVKWSLAYSINDKETASANDGKLSDVEVKLGKNCIRSTMLIEGFAPVVQEFSFDVLPIVYNFGLEFEQSGDLQYLRRKISSGSISGEKMRFSITNDGQNLSKDQLKELKLKLVVRDVVCNDKDVTGFLNRLGKIPVDFRFNQLQDGSFIVEPKGRFPLTPFLIRAGKYTVEVGLEGEDTVRATGVFTIIPSFLDWLFLLLILALLAAIGYLIFIVFVKKKFTGQTLHYDVYAFSPANNTGVLLPGQSESLTLKFYQGHLFKMTGTCYIDKWGLRFEASGKENVFITSRSIVNSVDAYVTMPANPINNYQGIIKNMRVVAQAADRQNALPAQQSLSRCNPNATLKRAFYFVQGQNGRLYCIWTD